MSDYYGWNKDGSFSHGDPKVMEDINGVGYEDKMAIAEEHRRRLEEEEKRRKAAEDAFDKWNADLKYRLWEKEKEESDMENTHTKVQQLATRQSLIQQYLTKNPWRRLINTLNGKLKKYNSFDQTLRAAETLEEREEIITEMESSFSMNRTR